jgi:hypothetical protein
VSLGHAFYNSSSERDLVDAGGRIIGAPYSIGHRFFAKAFDYGELIRPGSLTSGNATLAYRTETPSSEFSFAGGEFIGLDRAYLGITFQSEANSRHVGWLEVDAYLAERLRIYGYAYETTPGKSIPAGAVPEPPSLVMLAAGAAGLAALRRTRSTHRHGEQRSRHS